MAYSKKAVLRELVDQVGYFSDLKHEVGAKGIEGILKRVERELRGAARKMEGLKGDAGILRRGPDGLWAIRKLRGKGPRRMAFDQKHYKERLEGAFLARCAGCTLGAIVEGWPVADMERFAGIIGDAFPPTNYWSRASAPHQLRYETNISHEYTRGAMKGVPVDDDIAYTLLGLLIVEEYGAGFTTEEVGRAWLKYLPHACTAEEVALENLKKGVSWRRCAVVGNPFTAWIGADIRSDPWGYVAPGWPEKAAEMAYRDAFISHRGEGIFGEMFFSAAIAAAFAASDPMEAVEIGLTEIPKECATARAVRWALKLSPKIKDYKAARGAVDERFAGMHHVHTVNNACLTVFGIAIGGKDVTKVISQTVAMGLDNDCTAATAGSIVGAVVGKRGVAGHWTRPFGNEVHSYLKGKPRFRIDDLLRRFEKAARRVTSPRSHQEHEDPRKRFSDF